MRLEELPRRMDGMLHQEQASQEDFEVEQIVLVGDSVLITKPMLEMTLTS